MKPYRNKLEQFKKIIKIPLIALMSLIVSKYLILWCFPSSKSLRTAQQETNITTNIIPTKVQTVPQEVVLTIDYKKLKKRVDKEYIKTTKDLDKYIAEQIGEQRKRAYYQLSKDDGFLDWVFGYFTGYKMMWKKIKGVFGSDDNEIKLVSDKFQKDVMDPGYRTMVSNIQSYRKHRVEDYTKNVLILTSKYVNENIKALKKSGYEQIEVAYETIPWNKYMVSGAGDGFMLLEMTGVIGVSPLVGKFVGAKVATLLGPKVLTLIGAKTATVVAGKIAASFSLIFAPLVDYGLNEAAKKVQYDSTQKDFEHIITNVLEGTKKEIMKNTHTGLDKVKNSLYKELNKTTKIKAKR